MPESNAKQNTPIVAGFMKAVRSGEYDVAKVALAEDPALVHAYDYDCFGATALINAGNRCDRAMVDLLLEHGGDINARSDWWAGSFGVLPNEDRAMAGFLIQRGAAVDVHTAAAMGDIDKLRAMLDADAELIHSRGGDGQLPLHFADTPEVAAFLLERGADLNARDIDHESTAAHWQASRRPAVARYLVERGAEPDIFLAIAVGDLDLVRKLLADDPKLLHGRVTEEFFPTSDGTPALHIYAYMLGHDSTLLHVAANRGQVEIARFLLDGGADPNAAGAYDDCTPLHQAAWDGHVAVAEVLLDRGADIDRKSGKIHTNEPVGWAAVAGNVAMVELLLKRGARVQPYHIKDARAGEQGGINYTKAPREAFTRIAGLFERWRG